MNRESDKNRILIFTENGEVEQDLVKSISKTAPCTVMSYQDLITGKVSTDPLIVVLVFDKSEDSNNPQLLTAREKFSDAALLVVHKTEKINKKLAHIHKDAIDNGADQFLLYPSQLELIQTILKKLIKSKEDLIQSKRDLELKDTLSLAKNEIFSELEIKSLLRKIIERTLTLTNADIGTISLINERGVTHTETWNGDSWNDEKKHLINISGDSDTITCFTNNINGSKPVHFKDEEVESFLNMPMLDRDGNVIAIFEIAKREGHFYADRDYRIMEELARAASPVLENLKLLNYTKTKLESSKFHERSFRHLIENSPYSIILIQHNKIMFVNKTVMQQLGYTRSDLLYRNIIEIIEPGEIDELMATIKKVQKSGRTSKLTTGIKSKDGNITKFELEVGSMVHEGKQSVQLIARELTPETGISKEAVRLAAAVNSLHSAVTITDMNRKIIYVNPAHRKCFRYEPNELLGRESSILFPFDDPSGVSEKIYDAIQMLGWEGERIGVRKNGQVFPVYEKISVVKDKNGDSVGIVSILDEITERKRLEQALRESEERYRALVDTANTAIIAVDEKGKITFFNPAAERLFAYDKDELMDRHITVLMPKKYRQVFKEKISNSSEAEFVDYLRNTVEFTGLKKGGEEVPLEISISKCRIEGTKIYTAIIMDITERKNLQEQLIQSAKLAAIGELISGVTHEVNNPLAIVLGYAEMIMKEQELDEDTKKYAGIIHKESERARKVIQNLLSFARQHDPEKEEISVNELLDNTLLLAEYDLKKNNINIKKSYARDLPSIMADPNQLQQVFLNLLINAQQAVADNNGKGEISIETSLIENDTTKNSKFVKIIIRDNGKGIKENVLNKIFDPFFTTKPVNKGTGLGLSVSHGIIKEHSGNIYAVNNEKSDGARFCIELPL